MHLTSPFQTHLGLKWAEKDQGSKVETGSKNTARKQKWIW